MTAASEEVPAEEGLGSADLLAALRAVARRLRQACGTFHLPTTPWTCPWYSPLVCLSRKAATWEGIASAESAQSPTGD
jgi:hypothetical protein